MPMADPTGGFFFVFQTGRPMFRKYDAKGNLQFERHIEGAELDDQIRVLPTSWPRRTTEGRTMPLVLPLVRTAAVDPSGRLWVSLITPQTYVYDRNGDKVRTVQFQATGIIAPTSLSFAGRDRLLITPGCYEFRHWAPGCLRETARVPACGSPRFGRPIPSVLLTSVR